MPTFMRSHSSGGAGGKSRSGGSGSRGGRAPPPGKPQKIIQAPAFEKIELQRSENAWVRPSEKAKAMSEEERAMDVRLSLFMYKFFKTPAFLCFRNPVFQLEVKLY